jgi:16S rRNA (guanine527-N7)-methyltransferase
LPREVDATPALGPSFANILDAGLTLLGLTLEPPARAAIEAHARLLLAWNEHVNLSGLHTPEQVARGHVLDSLLAVKVLSNLAGPRPALLDLGSGGGYPGLPLAIALPAARAALVDSIRKKAAFLEVAAVAAAEIVEVTALAERAEDLADEHDQRESWGVVTARAVGSVAEVAELSLPLLKVGGHVVAWKLAGPESQLKSEIAGATQIISAAGGDKARIVEQAGADLVGLAGHCLVVIKKVRPTPDRYPRPPGERRRRPLP